ncbi:transcription factor e(y)2-domain-containing protein [Naematelia encephala]|uniref:Transcription and mRNA export factor SUS1 n=1 Tax=Naematelia encephala TaxID=71784 RepID=A0A1Y2ARY3_9TREE|nr:transcription factor e(y)2-domain-containing protein [Naematelia encephala]
MASAPQPDPQVMDQVRRRLLETGDWDRISQLLRAKLEEVGWDDDLKDLAKEKARAQETPNLRDLLVEVNPQAQKMIPGSIRRAVLQEIEAVLDREVEKA